MASLLVVVSLAEHLETWNLGDAANAAGAMLRCCCDMSFCAKQLFLQLLLFSQPPLQHPKIEQFLLSCNILNPQKLQDSAGRCWHWESLANSLSQCGTLTALALETSLSFVRNPGENQLPRVQTHGSFHHEQMVSRFKCSKGERWKVEMRWQSRHL